MELRKLSHLLMFTIILLSTFFATSCSEELDTLKPSDTTDRQTQSTGDSGGERGDIE